MPQSNSTSEETPAPQNQKDGNLAAGFTNLPLPEFTSLVGVEKYHDQLARLFYAPDGPRLVSLEGMGGIGKSALARAFIGLPETAAHWEKIVWVSARQHLLSEEGQLSTIADAATTLEDVTSRLCDLLGLSNQAASPLEQRLEALQTTLNMSKHLVVVDNLETVEEYLRLVPTLGQLAGVSRFLITTRQTLQEFPYVHAIELTELEKRDAFHLVEAEMARRGQRNPLTREIFNELYPIIGGHPLALKLAAAQIFLRPLSEILLGFNQARGSMDDLYRYLYWQTWHSLSDSTKRLLLSFLPSDPEGEDAEFLQLMSGQPADIFHNALRELDRYSLLEVNGDPEFTLYRLHSLTVTFLRTDILSIWSDQP